MSEVILNEAALRELLESQNGPVAKDLARRCIAVESQAKVNATGRPGPNVDTGRLRNSITWRLVFGPEGLYGEVGSNVEYAAYVEYGTAPHVILPKGKLNGGKAALYWKGARHPVARVNHPGNPAYPYLRPALVAAGNP